MWASGGYVASSDARLKEDIQSIKNGVEFILKINPVQYKMVDGSRKHFGFIAQDVKTIMDETVGDVGLFVDPKIKPDWDTSNSEDDDKPHFLALRYDEFIAPMVQTIQYLEKRISALEGK